MYLEFAAWLREQIRRYPNLNQTGLAYKLGVEKSTVSAWTRGIAAPREKHLEALADLFGADITMLYVMLGRIPPGQDFDAEVEMLARRIGQAPAEVREKLIDLIIALLDMQGV